MNSSRKKLIAGIAISAGVLAGCGGQGASTQHKDAHSVRLVSWGTNEQIKLFRASLAKFTKKTGIAVQVIQEPGTNYAQKINAQILSKSLPDVFWCQNSMAQDLGRQGKLFNWSDYASGKASGATDAGLDITKFSPGAVDTYRTPDGGLAGIPNEANPYGRCPTADRRLDLGPDVRRRQGADHQAQREGHPYRHAAGLGAVEQSARNGVLFRQQRRRAAGEAEESGGCHVVAGRSETGRGHAKAGHRDQGRIHHRAGFHRREHRGTVHQRPGADGV